MKKRPLFLWLGIFVGTCIFLFYVFYFEAKKNAIQKLNEEQLIYAKQAAQGIKEFFETWTNVLDSLSRMDEIINTDIDGQRYMWQLFESHQEQIKSITRVDEKGTILYTVPYSHYMGSNISRQSHFQKVMKERKAVVSNVFKAVQGFDVVAIHVPIFKGRSFKGTIAILIDFKRLAKRYLDVIRIGETGRAWLINREGIQLYNSIPELVGKSSFEVYKDSPKILSMVNKMLQGHQGVASFLIEGKDDQKGKFIKQHAVYLPIHVGNTFWSIAVISSEKEVLSTLSFFRNRLVLLMGLILIGGLLFFIKLERSRKKLQNLLYEMSKTRRELESTNERLKEVDRLKSSFLATMSHELRTPLNSIIGFTGILLQGLAGPLNEEQQKQLNMVHSSARHLLALINDVLDISKIEAGQLVLSPSTFNLRSSIEKIVNMISPMADKKGLKLSIHISEDVGSITIDKRRFEQIIINLLNNAVKFTERGEVSIFCSKENDDYLISVKDTGIGIRPEEIEHIYKPFHQIDTGLTRKYEGSGLGLSISKRLIEMMGGSVRVFSQWGQGSTFTVRLPSSGGQ